MFSSGTTAIATSTASWTDVPLAIPAGSICNSGYIINEGTVAGFFRINGGPACRLPAGNGAGAAGSGSVDIREPFAKLEVQRVGSTNLGGIFGMGFQ